MGDEWMFAERGLNVNKRPESPAAVLACPLKLAVNYGLDPVRFPAPVLVGSRIRARVVLSAAKDIQGGLEVTWNVAIECEGGDKPSCVAQWVVRYHL